MARLPRIPDLLTTANLACGVGSILLASQGQLTLACWLVFAGAVFDVFDGLAARALGGGTPLGAQLDSLADMVTFGVAPAFIATISPLEALQLATSVHREFVPSTFPSPYGEMFGEPLWASVTCALVITTASAWRLAKFNTDTRQSTGFLGLATPANALFWASMGCITWGIGVLDGPGTVELQNRFGMFMEDPVQKLTAALLLGILMLSELPLPSLKFKHFKWKGNEVIFLLMGAGLVLVLLYGILAVPLILLLYLLSPLWGKLFPKPTEK
ncbi:MAG TPA: CDP-alcohol phosphatidyltransferase family protein [Flavobacteriales bacterium]|nr:CDP-alcohol phosphatidyltransferase family protein [Flavobacteriales bacterium]